eukprot:2210892-Karenia_brevis.AAC.1
MVRETFWGLVVLRKTLWGQFLVWYLCTCLSACQQCAPLGTHWVAAAHCPGAPGVHWVVCTCAVSACLCHVLVCSRAAWH